MPNAHITHKKKTSKQVLNEEYARVVETLLLREAQAVRQQRIAAHARALVAAGAFYSAVCVRMCVYTH